MTTKKPAKQLRLPDAWKPTATELQKIRRRLKRPPVIVTMIEWFDDHYYKVEIIQKETAPTVARELAAPVYLKSTTTILDVSPKPGIVRFRGDVGNREADRRMEEAGDRGSRVHHACYALANGGCVVYQAPWNKKQTIKESEVRKLRKIYKRQLVVLGNQREAVMAWRFQRWLGETKAQVLSSEVPVANLVGGYAGTIDHLLWIPRGSYDINGTKPLQIPEDGLYVVDLKTGNNYRDHPLQVASYVEAYKFTYPNERQPAGSIVLYLDAETERGIPGVKTELYGLEEQTKNFEAFLVHLKLWEWAHPKMSPEIFSFPNIIYPQGQEPTKLKLIPGKKKKEDK